MDRRQRFAAPLVLAVLMFAGAGCVLDRKLDWRLPFSLGQDSTVADSATNSLSISLRPGLAFTVRPSTLGLSGSVDQVLGLDAYAVKVSVTEAGADKRVFAWQGSSATGTIALGGFADAQAMLLPAFWQDGAATASRNGGLWLSRAAYEDVKAGHETEWRLGLADGALATVSNALRTFNTISSGLFGSATAAPEISPFSIQKTGTAEAFPLSVDGKMTLLRTIQASGWFADLVILDNPENPLILKVSIHPAAAPALKALEPARVQWNELGYEITTLERP